MSPKFTSEKVALVCGAGGFIGHHLVRRLKREGFWVRAADLKFPRFSETEADDFLIGDLRDPYFVDTWWIGVLEKFINLQPIWVEPVIFSRVNTMRM